MSLPLVSDQVAGVYRTGRPTWQARLAVFVAAAGAGALVGIEPILGIVAAVMVFLGVLVMVKPDWATYLAVALLYSNAAVIAHRIHGLPKPVAQGAALLVAVALVHHLGVRREPVLLPAALPWVAALLIVQVVGAARALEPGAAIESVQDFLTGGLFLYLAFSNAIRSFKVLRAALWIVLTVGALVGTAGLHQAATERFEDDYLGFAQISEAALERHGGAQEAPNPRLSGPIGEKNFFAQMMYVLVPIGLMLAVASRRWPPRLTALGLTALTTLGGGLAVSRGGAVGLALGLVVLAGLRYLPFRYVLLVIVGIAILLTSSPRYAERLSSIASAPEAVASDGATGDVDGATMGRLGSNAAAFRVFAGQPILGVGPGMFNLYYREQAIEAGVGKVHQDTRSAHNLPLQIAAEFGIIGFVALFGAVGVTLRDLQRARRRMLETRPELAAMLAGIFGAIVTYLGTGLFLSLAYERYFWFLMALGAAGVSVASQEERTITVPSELEPSPATGGERW
jgi:putative inorganic carbon (hco3(-)) transporter